VRALAPNIRVLGMAGEGGMALVFVGRDSVLKREVAIKLLSPALADDVVARKRFTREAEAIAAVSHPNIVNVYHVGEVPGAIPYFVMQYVDGPTLGMGALQGRMLTELRVRRLVADVAAGLSAAHRRKVYHRDIKPSNIVLDGETGRALVLDFGISAAYSSRRHSLGRRLTDEGMYLGTPTYMSPEQGAGEEVTGASDVYSLGVLAFELLVGHAPFEGSPVHVMASHMNETPKRVDELRSDVSDELATLIARCLEKSPARRPTAEEIVHFLNPAEHQVVEWPPPGMAAVRRAGARLLSAAAMTSLAVAIFFGALGMWPALAELRRVGGEPNVLRSFLVGAGLAIVFSAAAMLAFYAMLALQRWRWATASGYPMWVVSDVLADTKRDSGNLINGTGEFVLLTGPTRRLLLALRRTRFGLVLAGAVVALLGIVAWIIAWMRSGGSDAAQPTAMLWGVPILITYLLFFVLGAPEWRVRRRERGRAARKRVDKTPPLRGELVQMWMASAERARKALVGDPSGRGGSGSS
ncbi:MAG TPA: serine/threonine-protein kinase, partial [Gemmatimonadaceae bacterium]|nr:serine/threonine-protein kinase [Gemmatimonadaceae bacterium]